jgi:hypothetical protein
MDLAASGSRAGATGTHRAGMMASAGPARATWFSARRENANHSLPQCSLPK